MNRVRHDNRGFAGWVGARRRGQALLLSVLIMVFAALLGATFVTIVALNLSQTAKSQDLTSARQAADTGMQVINAQLVANGEAWRPQQVSMPPASNDTAETVDYDNYYSPLAQAMGWSEQSPFNDSIYVQFPDPRQPYSPDAPTFLAQVHAVNAEDVTPAISGGLGTDSPDKTGMLRITIVGLAQNDANVFYKKVAYKPTSENGGPGYFARYDANWNTAENKPLTLALTVPVAGTDTTLSVEDAIGVQPGQTLLLHDGTVSTDTPVVVQSVNTSTTPNTVSLNGAVGVAYPDTATVALASQLSSNLQSIYADAPGGTSATEAASNALVPTQPTWWTSVAGSVLTWNAFSMAGGVRLNGGAVLAEQAELGLNSEPLSSGNPTLKYTLAVAGRIAQQPTVVGASYYDTTVVNQPVATPTASYLDINTGTSAQIPESPVSGTTLVQDGTPNGQSDPTSPTSSVQPLAPPRIDGSFSPYLQMTKYADISSGSQYGYGPGLYIRACNETPTPTAVPLGVTDSPTDLESVATNTGTTYRPLATSDLQRLYQRKSFPNPGSDPYANIVYATAPTLSIGPGTGAHRLAFPRVGPNPIPSDTYIYPCQSGSLEERGVRGWVNPWEFHPRGALIDLQGDMIEVTLDDRSDALATGLDSTKAWTDNTNNLLPGTYRYRMLLDASSSSAVTRHFDAPLYTNPTYASTYSAPFNGVIYAEGNVRIRGYWSSATPLTVVSMGNIYVEGNLRQTNTGQIALLAKDNVAVNPTQVLSHPAGEQDDDLFPTAPAWASATPVPAPASWASLTPSQTIYTPAAVPISKLIAEGQVVKVLLGNQVFSLNTLAVNGSTAPYYVTINSPPASTIVGTTTITRVVDATVGSGTLTVVNPSDASLFAVGDQIMLTDVSGNPENQVHTIYDMPTPGTLDITPAINGITGTAEIVPVEDAPTVAGNQMVSGAQSAVGSDFSLFGATTSEYFRMMGPYSTFLRNFNFEGDIPTGSQYCLSMLHSGELKDAYTLTYNYPSDGTFEFKPDLNADNSIESTTEKVLNLGYNGGSNTENLINLTPTPTPTPVPANPGNDTTNSIQSLTLLVATQTPTPGPPPTPAPTPYWTVTNIAPTTVAARRVITTGATPVPYTAAFSVPMTVSAHIYSVSDNAATTTPSVAPTASAANILPAISAPPLPWLLLGSAFNWFGTASQASAALPILYPASDDASLLEDVRPTPAPLGAPAASGVGTGTLASNFYTNTGTDQATLQPLSLEQPTQPTSGTNPQSFGIIAEDTANIPSYRLGAMRYENGNFTNTSFAPIPIEIDATVVAQNGSWFVIPMPAQSPPGTTGAAASHFRRSNYEILVNGNISQNYTPGVDYDSDTEPDPDNRTTGAEGSWMDALSCPSSVSLSGFGQNYFGIGYTGVPVTTPNVFGGYLPNQVPTPVPTFTPVATEQFPETWRYTDPNNPSTTPIVPASLSPYLPMTPDLIYVQ